MHHRTLVRHQRFADNLILAVQREPSVLNQILQKRCDILRVHLAGVIRNGRRQVQRAQDADATLFHHLAGLGQLAIASALRRDVHDQRTRRHMAYHIARDQDGRLLSGYRGSGDDDMLITRDMVSHMAPGSIWLTISRVIRMVAFFPGTAAVVMTTCCSASTPAMSSRWRR